MQLPPQDLCEMSNPNGFIEPNVKLCAGNGYLCNTSPSQFAQFYEAQLPESMSGSEFLAMSQGQHWDTATQVRRAFLILLPSFWT